MRKRKRDDLARLIDEVVIGVLEPRLRAFFGDAARERLGESDRIVKAIEHLRVPVVTQQMADDIVRKIHGPLTIGQEFSDSLRRLAEHRDWYQTFAFGYGGEGSGRLEVRVKADGALHLQITAFDGAPMWQGTFVPPGYGA